MVVFVVVGVGGRLSFLTDLDDGSRFDLISDLLHLREKLCPLGRVDTELSCRERQDTIVDFREFLDLFLDLCGTVRAVDVFHHVDDALRFRSGSVVVFLVTFVMLAVRMSTVIVIIVIIAAVVLAIVVMVVSAATVFMFMVLVVMRVMMLAVFVVLIVVMMVSAAAFFSFMLIRFLLGSF